MIQLHKIIKRYAFEKNYLLSLDGHKYYNNFFDQIRQSMKNSQLKSQMKNNFLPPEETKAIHAQLKKVHYPIHAISTAQTVTNKISDFPSKQKAKIKDALGKLNAYRQVRGDGNCFFRALAFTYLSNLKDTSFGSNFSFIDEILLTECFEVSIPKQFKKYYDDKTLRSVLKAYWEADYNFFLNETKHNHRRALARLLTENPYMDFIIILYFRSVCFFGLNRKKQQMKQFLKGTQEIEIKTYGEESQGVIFNLCNKFLQVDIYIYQIRKEEVLQYQYKGIKRNQGGKQIHLLFYEGHYDLVEENDQIYDQKYDKKQERDYYSEINQNMIEGVCFQCSQNRQIFEDSGVCEDCYKANLQNLGNFQQNNKDKYSPGICNNCQRRRSKVSEQFMICQECMEMQSSYQKSSTFKNNQEYKQNYGSPSKNKDNNVYHDNNTMNKSSKKKDICKQCKQQKTAEDMVPEVGMCMSCFYLNQLRENQQKKNKSKSSKKKDICKQCKQEQTAENMVAEVGICTNCLYLNQKRENQQKKFNQSSINKSKLSPMINQDEKPPKNSQKMENTSPAKNLRSNINNPTKSNLKVEEGNQKNEQNVIDSDNQLKINKPKVMQAQIKKMNSQIEEEEKEKLIHNKDVTKAKVQIKSFKNSEEEPKIGKSEVKTGKGLAEEGKVGNSVMKASELKAKKEEKLSEMVEMNCSRCNKAYLLKKTQDLSYICADCTQKFKNHLAQHGNGTSYGQKSNFPLPTCKFCKKSSQFYDIKNGSCSDCYYKKKTTK